MNDTQTKENKMSKAAYAVNDKTGSKGRLCYTIKAADGNLWHGVVVITKSGRASPRRWRADSCHLETAAEYFSNG